MSVAMTTAISPVADRTANRQSLPVRAWYLIERWMELARQRQQLAALDDRMLKDIGISRATAQSEARRPFWDLPV